MKKKRYTVGLGLVKLEVTSGKTIINSKTVLETTRAVNGLEALGIAVEKAAKDGWALQTYTVREDE